MGATIASPRLAAISTPSSLSPSSRTSSRYAPANRATLPRCNPAVCRAGGTAVINQLPWKDALCHCPVSLLCSPFPSNLPLRVAGCNHG